TFIQRTKEFYQDTRTQRNVSKLNDELYEVHQIMPRNVQEVLGVGEKLDPVKGQLHWNELATTTSTSQVSSARSSFGPKAHNPPYIPAALTPSAAVTPPGIFRINILQVAAIELARLGLQMEVCS
ncbi:hypothetical protein Tco_0928598, partial [Tanacetum coccineum]